MLNWTVAGHALSSALVALRSLQPMAFGFSMSLGQTIIGERSEPHISHEILNLRYIYVYAWHTFTHLRMRGC